MLRAAAHRLSRSNTTEFYEAGTATWLAHAAIFHRTSSLSGTGSKVWAVCYNTDSSIAGVVVETLDTTRETAPQADHRAQRSALAEAGEPPRATNAWVGACPDFRFTMWLITDDSQADFRGG